MSSLKFNLWFLTVTFGNFLLLVGIFSNSAEVGAVTTISSNSTSNSLHADTTDGNIRKGTVIKIPSANNNSRINTKTSTTKDARKSKIKRAKDENRRKAIGYAAEWEYKGSGLEELDEPFETKHQEKQATSSSMKPKNKMDHVPHYPSLSPSRRLGPGSWLDSNGYWWIFGGQGPSASVTSNKTSASSIHYLSDLWVYGPPRPEDSVSVSSKSANPTTKTVTGSGGEDQNPYWRLVYRPENDGESPLSSHPENVLFPLLCGSENSEHLALFGGGQNEEPMLSSTYQKPQETTSTVEESKPPMGTDEDESTHNSMFTEDNVVWLYDIPKSFEKIPRRTIKSGGGNACNWSGKDQQQCNGTGRGLLWTSYICCDACLPDGNTTFDFCPQFSREPILWCNQDSLMAFQLTSTRATTTFTSKDSGKKSNDTKSVSDAQGKQPTYTVSSTTLTETESPFNTFASSSSLPSSKIPEVSQQSSITDEDILVKGSETKIKSLATGAHISKNIPRRESFVSNGKNSQGVGQQGEALLVERIGTENEKKTMSESVVNGKSPKSRKQQKSEVLVEERVQSMRQETKEKSNNNNNIELKEEINTREEVAGESGGGGGNTKQKESEKNSSVNSKDGSQGRRKLGVNWWKFDLTSTEWIKMPEVNINEEDAEKVRSGNCRTVSDSDFLYILCPTKTNLLDRSVLMFDPSKGTILPLGTIHLNNAFHDKKVWHLGRSVFHALRSDNQTVIFLAYHKLLDLWIHDHSSNKLIAVENVWKGSSLHAFQHTSSFYKLTIVLTPSSFSTESTSGSSSSNTLKETHHSFYMANPRSKLFTFDDPFPDGHFRITIVTDQAVFLPSRDAPYPYLINSTDFSGHKSVYNPENASTTFQKAQREQNGSSSVSSLDVVTVEEAATSDATKVSKVPLTSTTTTRNVPSTKEPKYDQELPIPISTYNPQPDPTLERSKSISQSESTFKEDEEETQIDKTNVPEGMRTVTGLRKAHGSSFNSTRRSNSNKSSDSIEVPTPTSTTSTETHTTTPDLFTSTTTKGDAAVIEMRAEIPDPAVPIEVHVATASEKESQSKPNPTLQRNYNKTNNSQLRSRVEVISGGKKRILGIKRTQVVAKIDSHSSQNSLAVSMKSISNTNPIIATTNSTTSGNSGILSSHSTNTIRSKAGRSSLPVNNESNRKPLSTSTESPANSRDTPGGVMKVLSENSYAPYTMTTNMSKTSEKGDSVEAKNKTSFRTKQLEEWRSNRVRGVNLSNRSPSSPKASALKVASQAHQPQSPQPESLPANLGTKIDQVNTWTQPKIPKIQTSYSGSNNNKNIASSTRTNSIVAVASMLQQKRDDNHNHNHHEDDDYDDGGGGGVDGEDHHQPNLQNNYYISPMKKRRKLVSSVPLQNGTEKMRNESFLMSHSVNDSFMGDMMGRDLSPLTYGSSEILIESPNDDIQSIPQDGDESYYTSYSTFGSLLFFSLSLSMFATFGLVLFVKRCVKCPPRRESVLLKEPPPIRYSVIPDELSFHTPIV